MWQELRTTCRKRPSTQRGIKKDARRAALAKGEHAVLARLGDFARAARAQPRADARSARVRVKRFVHHNVRRGGRDERVPGTRRTRLCIPERLGEQFILSRLAAAVAVDE